MISRTRPLACLALGVLAMVVTVDARAGVIRDDRADSLYTGLAAEARYDSVGRFEWDEPGGSFLGSGVLISEEWVLTAAHVIGGTDNLGGGITNLEFFIDGLTRTAAEWIPHPQWASSGGESNLLAGWDIGLVRLDTVVNTVTPATLYTGSDELGEIATTVGFGATGNGLTGDTGPSGTKRAGNNVVDVVGTATTPGSAPSTLVDRFLEVDFDNPADPSDSTLGDTAPLDLEYLVAPGDSGSGLFIEIGGQTVLAGITSLGSATDGSVDSNYGERAAFTRVSPFIGWLEDTTGLVFDGVVVAGDYTGDGLVNLADWLLWFAQFEETGPGLAADGNGDGVVDAADYTIWRDNSALPSPFSNAVPEPSSSVAVIVGVWLASLTNRRHRGVA